MKTSSPAVALVLFSLCATTTAQAQAVRSRLEIRPLVQRDGFDPGMDRASLDLDANGKRDHGSKAGYQVTVVLLQTAEDMARNEEWLSAMSAQLADFETTFVIYALKTTPNELVAEIAAARAALAENRAQIAVWAYGQSANRVRMLIRHQGIEGFEERSLDHGRGGRAGAAESVALIVRSAVTALLGQTEQPIQPPPKAEPITPPPPPPLPQAQIRLSAHAGYAGEVAHSDGPPHQGFAAGLGLSFGKHAQLMVTYVLVPEIRVPYEELIVVLRRHPILLSFGLGHEIGRLRVGGVLALCVDPISDSSSSSMERLQLSGDGFSWLFSAAILARGSVELWPRMRLWIAAGGEAVFRQPRYLVEIDGQTKTVLEPLSFRPVWTAGMELDML